MELSPRVLAPQPFVRKGGEASNNLVITYRGSAVRNKAPVGHTSRHPKCVQCLHTSELISHRKSVRDSAPVALPGCSNFATRGGCLGAMSRIPREAAGFAHRRSQYIVVPALISPAATGGS